MASRAPIFWGGQQQINGGNFMSAGSINFHQQVGGNNRGLGSTAFTELRNNVVPGALHNSGEISDPPKCHPGTRVDVLAILMAWALAAIYEFPIRWLKGPAGAGKSAIMRSFAEMLVEKGLLLASFFFFRSDPRRNTAKYFIPTIAYQLYITVPPLQPWIERGIESNPLIFEASLTAQIQTVIINPLLHYFYDPNSTVIAPFPRVLLIDGLDECSGHETQQEILQTLCKMVQTVPIPIAIVIASRPEHQIGSAFELGWLNKTSSRMTLDDSFNPDDDIQRYYLDEFKDIRCAHPMRSYLSAPWPSQCVIQTLVWNASGQFIYAVTVIKFIKCTRHNPEVRLRIILGQAERGVSKPFQKLDLLYTLVFQNVEPEVLSATLRVLGIFLTPPNFHSAFFQQVDTIWYQSSSFVDSLLGFPEGQARFLLLDLESLLTVTGDWGVIRIHHTSLSDFLFDKSRAGDFFIDRGLIYADIASLCINSFCANPRAILSSIHFHSYILEQLQTCIQKATPTHDLRHAIISCDTDSLVKLPNYARPGTWALLFLAGLIGSSYPDAETMYQGHLHSDILKRIINSELIQDWSSWHDQPPIKTRVGRLLPFVLLLLLTPAVPQEAAALPFGRTTRRIFRAIHILPGLYYREIHIAPPNVVCLAKYWRSLARVIVRIVDEPNGLIHSEVGKEKCTDTTEELLESIYSRSLVLPPPYSMVWFERIIPILLSWCLVRKDLTRAIQKTQGALLQNGDCSNYPAITAAFDSYIQSAEGTY